jgi:hypothetical protein
MRRGLLKMSFVALLLVALIMTFGASVVLADEGGAPGAHGVDGKTFGGLVSDLAQSEPGAVADHVSSAGMGGGMPAAHGVSGKDFGAAVSALANSAPGAVADHVSGPK